MQRINELDQRSLESKPIPEDKLATLESFARRSEDIGKRDSRLNCQKRVQGGTTQVDITKQWAPVGSINTIAGQFCRDAAGTDIKQYHEVTETYGTHLTNQGDSTKVGGDGNVVCEFTHLFHPPLCHYHPRPPVTYIVDRDSCLDAMKKQTDEDSTCYGKDHKDTKGGYWKVDDVGLFGFEVYSGKPTGT
ncbi:MAG: hypothetical protein Q9198_006287 [Flavoplaca austrocitrina]